MIAATRPLFALLAAVMAVVVVGFAPAAALAAPTFPPLSGRVVDDAHVLAPATVTDLTNKLAAFEAKTGDQLVVVTLPDLQGYEIEDYGYQLGRAWQLGQKGKDNGVILIVVPSEHKVRIEVGYGLEPVLTDILSNAILQEYVLPKLRTGDYDGGATAGVDAIIAQLSADPAAAQRNVQQAAQAQAQPHGFPIGAIFGLFIMVLVFSAIFRRHGGGGGGMGWLLPMMILSSGSRRSGWGGGGWGGGGFGGGGGGFSGGGGSFGGGGASGGW